MFQFQNETFQFDFVKCQLQILKQSVAMATDLSFHSICKLLHIYFVKMNFNYLFSSFTLRKQEPLTP